MRAAADLEPLAVRELWHSGSTCSIDVVLTELALILCIALAALVFSAATARWALRRYAGSADAKRLTDAALRASEAFLWSENRRALIGTSALGVFIVAAHAVLALLGARTLSLKTTVWVVVALGLGALASCVVAYIAGQMALRASARTAAAAASGVEQALSMLVRSGGVVGIVADALSIASVAGLFGLIYLLGGGPARDAGGLKELLSQASVVLPGFGLGTVVAGLLLSFGGATYHVATHVAAAVGAEKHAGLDRSDPRNPAFVAELVGAHLGLAAARTVEMFVASTLGNVTAWCLGAALFATSPQDGVSWGLLTFPVVVRALGVFGSALGLMTARTAENENPVRALWRGQVVFTIITLGGMAGAAFWLLGPAWPYTLGAAALGLAVSGLVAHRARYSVERSAESVRELVESTRGGEAVTIARGLAHGLLVGWPPVLSLGIAIVGAWRLGEASGLSGGALFGISVTLSAVLAGGAYMLALNVVGPIATSARGMGTPDSRILSNDASRWLGRLEDAGFAGSAVSQTFFVIAGGTAAMLAVYTLPVMQSEAPLAALSIGNPVVLWSGLLGGAAILAFTGRQLAAAARGARAATMEIERQLRGFPRESGVLQLPPHYTPSYKAIVDQASRSALERSLAPVALIVFVPALLGVSLRIIYRSNGLAIQGLAAFVVIAAVTGVGTALAADGARAVLNAAHRLQRPRGSSAGFDISITGNAIADFIGRSAGPAALMAAKATAMVALVVASFLM